MTLFRPFLERWRLTALLASLGMLAIAHGFQTFGGFAPCALCLRQREVYWAAAAVAAAGFLIVRLSPWRGWRILSTGLLAAIFVVGIGIAVYHAGAEWKWWPGPTACANVGGRVSVQDMTALLQGAQVRPPACDEAPWVFLGLSMAGWNALISLALAGLSLMALRLEWTRR